MANNNVPYMTIPPPPLPDVYWPRNATSFTPGTDDGAEVEYSIRYERRSELSRGSAIPCDGTDERLSHAHIRTREEPLPGSTKSGSGVPSLAIYHICRICLRPRSARYHQEHPIPEDGLPPPPGICRRCRVAPAEETRKVTHIVEEHDSNDIKLGIRAFVPDEDYYSNQEMREKRAAYLLRHAEWQEIEPPRRNVREEDSRDHSYKHIRVNEPSSPSSMDDATETEQKGYIYRHLHVAAPPPPPPVATQPASPKRKEYIHRHIHVGVPPPPVIMAPSSKSTTCPGTAAQEVSDAPAKTSTKGKVRPEEVTVQYRQWPGLPPPPPMSTTGVRDATTKVNPAMDEQVAWTTSSQTAARQHSRSHRSVPSETEIRRLARDEVVRYRQAERKLEAHTDPYAHGKMVQVERVPVERRIESVRDVPEEKPWARPSESARRDSGVVLKAHVRAAKHKEEKQEVVVVCETGQKPRDVVTRQHRAAIPPPSSSASSAQDMPPFSQIGRASRSEKAVSEVQGKAEHWTTEPAQELDRETQTPIHSEKPDSLVGKWTSHDYWNEGEVAKTVLTSSTRRGNLKAKRLPKEDPGDGDRSSYRDNQTTSYERQFQSANSCATASDRPSRKRDLPYPQEDAVPVSMPSPRSHMSNRNDSPLSEPAPRDGDKEWIYVRRTVQSADCPWAKHIFDDDRRSDLDYKETKERFVHRKAGQDSPKTVTPPSKRRASDVISRVRFSNKLDVSPTPPDSDASSSEFRRSGLMKHQHDGPASNAFSAEGVEKADRGRSGSRTVTRGERGYYYERDTVRTREREYHEADRDRTPRPSDRGQRRSGTSETATGPSTLPSDIRPLARAFSESPSRETLRETARRQKPLQKPDSNGPYTVEHNRSDSVEAFDGSTVTTSSRSSSDKERRVRRRRGGRGGRR